MIWDGTPSTTRRTGMEVVHKYGADALRLYLINSSDVRAENLRFKEDGVKDIMKDVFLPQWRTGLCNTWMKEGCKKFKSPDAAVAATFGTAAAVTSETAADVQPALLAAATIHATGDLIRESSKQDMGNSKLTRL
ncbi:hypothetical protein pipiens_019884 [Culex pipiens pipiens]|uniref:Uncharacterized protein n=1 Tax=Culex pipiens pipiens TaxID=38569 RepID=A0ABD1DT33_CULPP